MGIRIFSYIYLSKFSYAQLFAYIYVYLRIHHTKRFLSAWIFSNVFLRINTFYQVISLKVQAFILRIFSYFSFFYFT